MVGVFILKFDIGIVHTLWYLLCFASFPYFSCPIFRPMDYKKEVWTR